MEGSALRNLKMFQQLCGKEPLKNVILATTFGSKVAKEDALRREEQLKVTPEFWRDMLERGSTMKRFVKRESTLEIVSLLIKNQKSRCKSSTSWLRTTSPLWTLRPVKP
jgi:hypothetical protein